MPDAISNTSPLLYLHRIDALGWLPDLFLGALSSSGMWISSDVRRRVLLLAGEGV